VPLNTDYFVLVLQSLYNLHLIQVHSVTDVDIAVITSCCDEAAVRTVAHASYLLRM
jgi:hypothetical protein